MVRVVLRFALVGPRLRRIEPGAWDVDEAVIRCYRAWGFVREALQRERWRLGDGGGKVVIPEQEGFWCSQRVS